MPRPIYASVSIAALTHNLATVRQHVHREAVAAGGEPPALWAVIKGNAYGHGIAHAVAGFGAAQGLAVVGLDEAVRCREAGWGGPILLLEGFFQPTDLEIVDRYHLTTTVHTGEQLDMLTHARLSRRLDILLKLNSGMNRLGFSVAAYHAAYARASVLQQQGLFGAIGNMTHFACADGPEGVSQQMQIFRSVTHALTGVMSVCNSAAILRYPEVAIGVAGQPSWARPGIDRKSVV
jgi:alanine racemase